MLKDISDIFITATNKDAINKYGQNLFTTNKDTMNTNVPTSLVAESNLWM